MFSPESVTKLEDLTVFLNSERSYLIIIVINYSGCRNLFFNYVFMVSIEIDQFAGQYPLAIYIN